MNTKQIAIYGGGFLVSFFVLLAAMYAIYPYLHPAEAEQAESQVSDLTGQQFDPDYYTPEAVDAMNRQITSLQHAVDSLSSSKESYETTIDSLQTLIAELKVGGGVERSTPGEQTEEAAAGPDEAAGTMPAGQQTDGQAGSAFTQADPFAANAGPQVTAADTQEANLEEISRSLMRLDEEALSPILNLLDDDQLVSLYKSSSNMQRQKLLQSLEPKKAAEILKKVMS